MNAQKLEALRMEGIRQIISIDDENILAKVVTAIRKVAERKELGRIPGLAYTHEERLAEIAKAEEELRLGMGIPSDELRKELASW